MNLVSTMIKPSSVDNYENLGYVILRKCIIVSKEN